MAQTDRRALESFIGVKQLTTNERQTVDRIRNTWREAMAQPLIWGKDREREAFGLMVYENCRDKWEAITKLKAGNKGKYKIVLCKFFFNSCN